jgi:hypothetical protein
MLHGGVYLGTAGADHAQSLSLGRVEVPWKAGDPTGDLPHRRLSRERRQRRERACLDVAERPQVAAKGVVAAGVSPLGDLRLQHGGIPLAGGEPFVQVGIERIQHAGPHAAGQQRLDIVGA